MPIHPERDENVPNNEVDYDLGEEWLRALFAKVAPAATTGEPSTMNKNPPPSVRKLAGIGLILLLILLWAAFVASLAQFVGGWPILVQAPFYLFMGIAWIIPLKPLVRWVQTGHWKTRPRPPR